jgi:hypothetical protein
VALPLPSPAVVSTPPLPPLPPVVLRVPPPLPTKDPPIPIVIADATCARLTSPRAPAAGIVARVRFGASDRRFHEVARTGQ